MRWRAWRGSQARAATSARHRAFGSRNSTIRVLPRAFRVLQDAEGPLSEARGPPPDRGDSPQPGNRSPALEPDVHTVLEEGSLRQVLTARSGRLHRPRAGLRRSLERLREGTNRTSIPMPPHLRQQRICQLKGEGVFARARQAASPGPIPRGTSLARARSSSLKGTISSQVQSQTGTMANCSPADSSASTTGGTPAWG